MDSPSQFTFVESNASSRRKTHISSTAKSVIRSHAMQQVWEQRRLQRARENCANTGVDAVVVTAQSQTSSKSKAEDGLPFAAAPRKKGVAQSIRKAKADQGKNLRTLSHNPSPAPPPPTVDGDPDHSVWEGSGHESHPDDGHFPDGPSKQGRWMPGRMVLCAPSPRALDMWSVDPFDTCALHLGVKESMYIDHYFQALSWRFTMPKRTWLRWAKYDAGLLHGILAMAAAHHSHITGHGFSNDAIYHHGQTIAYVQTCLLDPASRFSDSVIGSIGRMVVCHLVFGSRQHFVTHVRALQRIIEARGGLEKLGMTGHLKYVIASCLAGAATIWWDDVPLQLRSPYGPLEDSAVWDVPMAGPSSAAWGPGLGRLYEDGVLPARLFDICQAVIAMNHLLDSRTNWSEAQQLWYGEQSNKMSYRLAYLRESFEQAGEEQTGERLIRDGVRHVVHFYISAFQRDIPLVSNLATQALHTIGSILYRDDLEPHWAERRFGEARLWMLLISGAGSVWRRDRARAGRHLQRAAMQLDVREWEDAKEICHRFIYLDRILDPKASSFWDEFMPCPDPAASPASLDSDSLPVSPDPPAPRF